MRRLAILVVPFLVLLMTSIPLFAQSATVGTATSATLGTYLTNPAVCPLDVRRGDTAGVSNVTGTLADDLATLPGLGGPDPARRRRRQTHPDHPLGRYSAGGLQRPTALHFQ